MALPRIEGSLGGVGPFKTWGLPPVLFFLLFVFFLLFFFFFEIEVGYWEVYRDHLVKVRIVGYETPTDRRLRFQSGRQSGL